MGISGRRAAAISKQRGGVPKFGTKNMERSHKTLIVVLAVFLILLICIFGLVFFLSHSKEEADIEEKQDFKTENVAHSEEPENYENKTESEEKSSLPETAEKEEMVMEISGIPDEALDILEVKKSEIADALKSWADENGHSSANGAVFQEPMYIRFEDLKYTMDFRMTFGSGGNGVISDEEVYLSMDYYKNRNQFFFHK